MGTGKKILVDLPEECMDQPCPNCGNRQHTPGANTCRVCGEMLSAQSDYPGQPSGVTPRLPSGTGGQEPLVLSSAILLDKSGRRYPIKADGDTMIGSQTGADIVIQRSRIQAVHARIFRQENRTYIEAMLGGLVLVNGRATGRFAYKLRNQDVITVGENFQLLYQVTSHQDAGSIILPVQDEAYSPSYYDSSSPVTQPAQSNSDLYGRVRHVDGPYMEDPDPNLGRSLAQATKFVLAMWKPAFLLIGNNSKQVPARFLRIETQDGQTRMVKMKGNLLTGAIHTGDMVQFWGEWQHGTLLMHRGFNETAQTHVVLKQ